ncbi:hypothetical protein MJH54_29630, partial [Salmonella enterica subsp. enterica serovar Montevideo]|nr:hypothetical protein [Salmonella enterica subsp. enterica serovar Montevideo]
MCEVARARRCSSPTVRICRYPECVRFDVYRTAAVLEQNQGSQRANAFLISFCKKALPRLELV